MNEDKTDDPSASAPRAAAMDVDATPPANGGGKSTSVPGVSQVGEWMPESVGIDDECRPAS
jgi:hypothetical protein